MDDTERKIIPQLDDPMPGQRSNALEILHNHHEQTKGSFRDIVYDIDNSVPLQKYNDEVAQHDQTKDMLQQYMKANADYARQLAIYKAALALKNALPNIFAAAFLVAVGCGILWLGSLGYGWITGESRGDRLAVNQGLSNVLDGWKFRIGESGPAIYNVGGKLFWIIVRGEIESGSHTDREAHGLSLQCLHLHAAPATADSEAYLKPNPYSWFGSLSWAERATLCKPIPLQKAAK
jgi:hypothetical protein